MGEQTVVADYEAIGKKFRAIEFPNNCPFYIENWAVEECAIRKKCDFAKSNLCSVLRRLLTAFQREEFRVIQHLWHRAGANYYWYDLVEILTGVSWIRWQIKLGYWLMGKCREEPSCPFKVLLPENVFSDAC